MNQTIVYPSELQNDELCSYQGWQDNPSLHYDYRFGRALLGLAEHYEFQTNNRNIKYQVQVINDQGVERFKAPITFKIFDGHVYAILEDMPDMIFNQPFHFEVQKKTKQQDGKWMDDGKPISICSTDKHDKDLLTPSNNISMESFLDNYMPEIGFTRIKP